MDLSDYWTVARRRVLVIAVVFGAAVLASAVLMLVSPRGGATATAIVALRQVPDPRADERYAYDGFYAYEASEYVAEDLVWLLMSPRFLDGLKAANPSLASDIAASGLEVDRARRALKLTVSAPSPESAVAVSESVVAALATGDEEIRRYLASVPPRGAEVIVLYAPTAQSSAESSRLRLLLDLALRALLGLVAGFALALVVDHLDDTFRDRRDVERTLGLPVLGEVGPGRGRRARQSRR